jgi:hypothetical protein
MGPSTPAATATMLADAVLLALDKTLSITEVEPR